MGLFSYDNKFFQLLVLILDVVLLSLLWTVTSLPIVTMGASTAALYHTVDKVFRREEGGLWKEYWRVFARDFKRATGLWLILLLIAAVMVVNCFLVFSFEWETETLRSLMQIVVIFVVALIACWAQFWFPYLVRFDDPVKKVLKNTLAMMMAHSGVTIRLLGILLVTVFMENILAQTMPVLTIVMPVAYIVAVNRVTEKLFASYIQAQQSADA